MQTSNVSAVSCWAGTCLGTGLTSAGSSGGSGECLPVLIPHKQSCFPLGVLDPPWLPSPGSLPGHQPPSADEVAGALSRTWARG